MQGDTGLQSPIFRDEDKARAWLETRIWPNGPFCPHCGSYSVTRLEGEAHRPGLFQCNDCGEQFTVTVASAPRKPLLASSASASPIGGLVSGRTSKSRFSRAQWGAMLKRVAASPDET
jgi:transposase-like protein